MRIADCLAQTLVNHGVQHVFGMPGGEVLTLVDSFGAAGIRFVLARHETAAAIMAAGAATATHAPGVILTTLGPGLTNAINGIVDASQERVPLVVIAAEVDHGLRSRYTHQIFDQAALMRTIVKGTFEVEPGGAGAIMARALQLAMSPPMGPVYVAVSPATQKAEAKPGDYAKSPPEIFRPLPQYDDPSLKWVREKLAQAERPLIVCGWEAARAELDPGAAIVRLAEAHGAPIITTYKAKGLIPETHPLSLGAAGLSPLADRHLLPMVANADVVLLVGYDPIEMRPGWLDPFAPGALVIEITSHAPDHAMHAVSARLEGDVTAITEALLGEELRKAKGVTNREAVHQLKADITAAFAPSAPWGPHAVFAALEPYAHSGAILTVDSGAHRILLSQQMRITEPRGLLQSAGYCTMGAAIPLALGTKISEPGRHVIAVLGDGGLEMGLGELATLRDENVHITIVVLQDESLALIELKQREAQLATAGVRLGRTRYEDIATAMGGIGRRVASREALDDALTTAATTPTFTLIVCDIDAKNYDGRI